jgi:hypothetical protein
VRRAVGVVAVVVAALSAGVALAAGLALSPARLTVHSAAVTVPTSTCELRAEADTYADETLLLSNFGTATDLAVRAQLLGNRRSYLRFDLTACGLAATAEVKAAALTLYMSAAPTAGRTYGVHRLTATWGETTLNWSNAPASAAGATASTATGTTSGVTRSWDVTADVSAFVAGTAANHGWLLRDATEGGLSGVGATFGSDERASASERPLLTITYRT